LCAAPGSKTAQIIELLQVEGGASRGVVVANDADTSRCFMLAHQLRRFGQDSVLVTNHEAQSFPLYRPAPPPPPPFFFR
jgi:16S rRNA C967 or C1407 C5-methylase (RsmB/RsmF family)